MNVKALSLKTGEAIRNGLELFADGIEMIEPFLQAEVAQVVGTEFVAQEAGELLVLLALTKSNGQALSLDKVGRSASPWSGNACFQQARNT